MYRFGPFELDPDRLELRRDGGVVPAEPQVFDVIRYLVAHRDRVVPKHELLDELWGTRFVSEATLTTRIKEARRALGDDGQRQAAIRTYHGRGYRFVAEVSEAPAGGRGSNPPAGTESTGRAVRPDQQIRFCCTRDGIRLAHAVHGEGPPLVKAANWLTHLDYDWESPVWRHWLDGLGRSHTVLRYDERGCGLSDRDIDDFDLETWVRDLETVVDNVGLERFPLLGISQGAAVAIAYAVRHPDRVSHLVLYGAYAVGLLQLEEPSEERQVAARTLIQLARLGWGRGNPAFRQVFAAAFMPEGTQAQWRDFDELQQQTTSSENAARFLEAFFRLDVRDLAARVTVPTLVLHSRGDRVWSFRHGRRLAASIPGSRFVPLDSCNHLILADEPAWPRFLDEVEAFLATASPE